MFILNENNDLVNVTSQDVISGNKIKAVIMTDVGPRTSLVHSALIKGNFIEGSLGSDDVGRLQNLLEVLEKPQPHQSQNSEVL